MLESKAGYGMAISCAQAWSMLENMKTPKPDTETCQRKWRRLLAIMEVALRMPIYSSRFYVECIVLTWFFGIPGFGAEEDMEKRRRIPSGSDKQWTSLYEQVKLFEKPNPSPVIEKSDFLRYDGDEEFRAMCKEIHAGVSETLK
jgi:hypothetical protein